MYAAGCSCQANILPLRSSNTKFLRNRMAADKERAANRSTPENDGAKKVGAGAFCGLDVASVISGALLAVGRCSIHTSYSFVNVELGCSPLYQQSLTGIIVPSIITTKKDC